VSSGVAEHGQSRLPAPGCSSGFEGSLKSLAHTAWAGLPPGIASMVGGRLKAAARGVADTSTRSAVLPLKRGAMNFARCRSRREQLKRFYRLLDEKWLKTRPEPGRDWLICTEFSRQRYS